MELPSDGKGSRTAKCLTAPCGGGLSRGAKAETLAGELVQGPGAKPRQCTQRHHHPAGQGVWACWVWTAPDSQRVDVHAAYKASYCTCITESHEPERIHIAFPMWRCNAAEIN